MWLAHPPALGDAALARCHALLDDRERARLAGFQLAHLKREATVSRALVRLVVGRASGRAPETLRYRLGEHGRPSLDPTEKRLDFNSANDPGLVACALANGARVGIDVELRSRGEGILEAAETVFSVEERTMLAALPLDARRDRAVTLWTSKEALVKALGLGLSAPLLEMTITFEDAEPHFEGFRFSIHDVGNHRVALAVQTNDPLEVTLHEEPFLAVT